MAPLFLFHVSILPFIFYSLTFSSSHSPYSLLLIFTYVLFLVSVISRYSFNHVSYTLLFTTSLFLFSSFFPSLMLSLCLPLLLFLFLSTILFILLLSSFLSLSQRSASDCSLLLFFSVTASCFSIASLSLLSYFCLPSLSVSYLEQPQDICYHNGDGRRGGTYHPHDRLGRRVDGFLATLAFEVWRVLLRGKKIMVSGKDCNKWKRMSGNFLGSFIIRLREKKKRTVVRRMVYRCWNK